MRSRRRVCGGKLDDDEFRHGLMRRLRQLNEPKATRLGSLLMDRLFRYPALAATCMVAIALMAVVLRNPDSQVVQDVTVKSSATEDVPTTTGKGLTSKGMGTPAEQGSSGSLDSLWELGTTGQLDQLDLTLDREGEIPVYRLGEQLRIRLSGRTDTPVVLLAKDPAGALTQLQSTSGDMQFLEDPGVVACLAQNGLAYAHVPATEGVHQLKLLVFGESSEDGRSERSDQGGPHAKVRSYEVVAR